MAAVDGRRRRRRWSPWSDGEARRRRRRRRPARRRHGGGGGKATGRPPAAAAAAAATVGSPCSRPRWVAVEEAAAEACPAAPTVVGLAALEMVTDGDWGCHRGAVGVHDRGAQFRGPRGRGGVGDRPGVDAGLIDREGGLAGGRVGRREREVVIRSAGAGDRRDGPEGRVVQQVGYPDAVQCHVAGVGDVEGVVHRVPVVDHRGRSGALGDVDRGVWVAVTVAVSVPVTVVPAWTCRWRSQCR